jgi:Nucleotidyl transferase AbiEii toxin, Type IV TA system
LLLDDRHRDIARIALTAAGRKYGVAFAGGGALQVHDVSSRRTQDVDLFVKTARNVGKAARAIAAALEQAGYRVEVIAADEELWEFEAHPPDLPGPVQVQVAHFAFTGTVIKDVGPVVTLDYLATRKTVAILERHQVRDYVDIASLADAGYKVPRLLSMAFAEAPYLAAEDAGDAGVHLDRITNERIARELPPGKTPGWVRDAFASWPREPVHAGAQQGYRCLWFWGAAMGRDTALRPGGRVPGRHGTKRPGPPVPPGPAAGPGPSREYSGMRKLSRLIRASRWIAGTPVPVINREARIHRGNGTRVNQRDRRGAGGRPGGGPHPGKCRNPDGRRGAGRAAARPELLTDAAYLPHGVHEHEMARRQTLDLLTWSPPNVLVVIPPL